MNKRIRTIPLPYRNVGKCAEKVKFFDFPRWLSELLANQCRPICPGGPIGRHWLAGNSKGHRGNSKFFFLLAPNNDYGLLDTAIEEDAFF